MKGDSPFMLFFFPHSSEAVQPQRSATQGNGVTFENRRETIIGIKRDHHSSIAYSAVTPIEIVMSTLE